MECRRVSGSFAADDPYEQSPNRKRGVGEAVGGEAGFKTQHKSTGGQRAARTYIWYLVESGWGRQENGEELGQEHGMRRLAAC